MVSKIKKMCVLKSTDEFQKKKHGRIDRLKNGYGSAHTSEWTRASGRPHMLLRLMHPAYPLASFW